MRDALVYVSILPPSPFKDHVHAVTHLTVALTNAAARSGALSPQPAAESSSKQKAGSERGRQRAGPHLFRFLRYTMPWDL